MQDVPDDVVEGLANASPFECVCGWCGQKFPSFEAVEKHGPECGAMLDEVQKDAGRDERRRLENQLWEEEHAAA